MAVAPLPADNRRLDLPRIVASATPAASPRASRAIARARDAPSATQRRDDFLVSRQLRQQQPQPQQQRSQQHRARQRRSLQSNGAEDDAQPGALLEAAVVHPRQVRRRADGRARRRRLTGRVAVTELGRGEGGRRLFDGMASSRPTPGHSGSERLCPGDYELR